MLLYPPLAPVGRAFGPLEQRLAPFRARLAHLRVSNPPWSLLGGLDRHLRLLLGLFELFVRALADCEELGFSLLDFCLSRFLLSFGPLDSLLLGLQVGGNRAAFDSVADGIRVEGAARRARTDTEKSVELTLLSPNRSSLICHLGTGPFCLLATHSVETAPQGVRLPEQVVAHEGRMFLAAVPR